MNGSKTLKFRYLNNLSRRIGLSIDDLVIRYFQFRIDPNDSNTPAILIFSDERVTEDSDRYIAVSYEDIPTQDKIDEKMREVLGRFYYDSGYVEIDDIDDRYVYTKLTGAHDMMLTIIGNLDGETYRFLKEVNNYIEDKKNKEM